MGAQWLFKVSFVFQTYMFFEHNFLLREVVGCLFPHYFVIAIH